MIRRVLFVLALLAAVHPAAAQRVQRDSVGRFAVETGADPITDEERSWAAVADNAGTTHLYWACAGGGLVIQLQPRAEGAGRTVTWRFDRDAPRYDVELEGGREEGTARLPRTEHHAFTTRARSAGDLVIRQRIGGAEHDLFFDLRGSERALSRLPCVRSLRPSAAAAAPRRTSPYDLSAVEENAVLLNREEIAAALAGSLPDALRAVGGSVALRILVREDGAADADRAHVEQSSDPALDALARALVPRMRFTPSRVNGRPVRTWVTLPFAVQPAS